MRVLIVKTSSLGDVIHTLPALTDAMRCIPNLEVDWVVEEGLAEIPAWHPAVKQIIPIALRRWRKSWRKAWSSGEIKSCIQQLKQTPYDKVIDAQGLWKSALVAVWAQGERIGLNQQSAKEKGLSFFYEKTVNVPKGQHAVERVRQLFAGALGYSLSDLDIDYGLNFAQADLSNGQSQQLNQPNDYLVFLHSTAWETKKWPVRYWRELCQHAAQGNFQVKLPWGSEEERQTALQIADGYSHVSVLSRMTLSQMRVCLQGAKGVVAVDTGLGHLSAALAVPCVSMYGPTNPVLTSTYGKNQQHLHADFHCAPCLSRRCQYSADDTLVLWPRCFTTVQPDMVWSTLDRLMCGVPS
ncbi:Lipopolysaccharide heptosyltransferase 1 [Piscirickettsia salmonis]|uniref:Lipopolysaccharide heptosyltransferase 1 n=1 Tax=Piscirickettsia salmonis TaxID=1238 RepID=A0A1L6TDM7_PISSA|nr:lipopolysaccharide heptosyltransferase I [Piscirickettsia salmonis]AKP74553.1 ADP-heptose--LPS heptosyltransferase [Piscirickettsia salmonis LF-89 = ATCC VR-1361]ALB23542.1 lipopolysaccharide heptosyltransferase I [Piscirickettsia salmonis]ALY03414.1 ADP-heptose--LPS heptosyltransferase [Piscirickettsia salmonis]AMA42978.1 ADP-heptose--LPS heptosyltransferase [Piscirickettsia salmonis]AOS35448.1 ADP-heptose--LPS heptosyltransferase [Piscirickettsia salmonis]